MAEIAKGSKGSRSLRSRTVQLFERFLVAGERLGSDTLRWIDSRIWVASSSHYSELPSKSTQSYFLWFLISLAPLLIQTYWPVAFFAGIAAYKLLGTIAESGHFLPSPDARCRQYAPKWARRRRIAFLDWASKALKTVSTFGFFAVTSLTLGSILDLRSLDLLVPIVVIGTVAAVSKLFSSKLDKWIGKKIDLVEEQERSFLDSTVQSNLDQFVTWPTRTWTICSTRYPEYEQKAEVLLSDNELETKQRLLAVLETLAVLMPNIRLEFVNKFSFLGTQEQVEEFMVENIFGGEQIEQAIIDVLSEEKEERILIEELIMGSTKRPSWTNPNEIELFSNIDKNLHVFAPDNPLGLKTPQPVFRALTVDVSRQDPNANGVRR